MRVAIIGMGFIGRAQARMLADCILVKYDVADRQEYPAGRIAECDFAIISVGTPRGADGSADLSAVYEAFDALPPELPVLIRSTVIPGTTDTLQARNPGRIVAHCPEFMHERPGGRWAESNDVPFLIIGGNPYACRYFEERLQGYFEKVHACPARVAEIVKYVVNLHLAARVTFINEMSAVCDAYNVDWEDVRSAWLMDPRITPEYTGMKGFEPGFGGRCWPKDLSAIIAASEDAGYIPEFLYAIEDANQRFRMGS